METVGHGPAIFMAEGDGGHNLAGLTSGWGDGCYPTWIGRAASGEACALLPISVSHPAISTSGPDRRPRGGKQWVVRCAEVCKSLQGFVSCFTLRVASRWCQLGSLCR
ncbi:DUF4241 domain-containing protein [Streptomyces globisporus]|uniref:DUF4241 domain-containing protein n=1 Tax=Streptomyces globisporus TaxID=1908 RepID=UPI002D21966E|nr:DUF4241 domain-containing protein [Streptomyces globisporus]